MNRSELRDAIREDSRRTDYDDATVNRFIAEGESILLARLEGYGLEVELTDADRDDTSSAIYTLPSRVTAVRRVLREDGYPLTDVDETLIYMHRAALEVIEYCKRPTTLVIAGVPAAEATLSLHYYGVPPALTDAESNTLIDDYPGLYKDLAMVALYERAGAPDRAAAKLQKANGLIDELNRKFKKAIGGRQASNAYNVDFRSSY